MYTEKTHIISGAMRILERDIVTDDSVMNAACRQAADRLDELHALCSQMAEQLDGIVVDAVESGCDDPMPEISEVLNRWRGLNE